MTNDIVVLDEIDRQIIAILLKNAATPYSEIAKKIIISNGTVHVRMKKLENAGVIKGSTLILDHTRLGYDITAYVGVHLEKSSSFEDVIKTLKGIREVIEAHYTTGVYSILIKLVCKNTAHLRQVLTEVIKPIEGIYRTETILSLEESINRPVMIGKEDDL